MNQSTAYFFNFDLMVALDEKSVSLKLQFILGGAQMKICPKLRGKLFSSYRNIAF